MTRERPDRPFEVRIFDTIPTRVEDLPQSDPGVRHLFVGHGIGVSQPDEMYVQDTQNGSA